MKRAFHFCVECQTGPRSTHVFDGVITTDKDPFNPTFYADVKALIAANMQPARAPGSVTMRSLALLAESHNAV